MRCLAADGGILRSAFGGHATDRGGTAVPRGSLRVPLGSLAIPLGVRRPPAADAGPRAYDLIRDAFLVLIETVVQAFRGRRFMRYRMVVVPSGSMSTGNGHDRATAQMVEILTKIHGELRRAAQRLQRLPG